MKNLNRHIVVEDIWLNTQSQPDEPATWDEVEDANELLNPDLDSMESRG